MLLGKELFQEQIEAWAHGPVIPEVFHEFKEYGWKPIPPKEEVLQFEDEILEILRQVIDIYGAFPARRLEQMTHDDEPWKNARSDSAPEDRCNVVIDKHDIKNYFIQKYKISNE